MHLCMHLCNTVTTFLTMNSMSVSWCTQSNMPVGLARLKVLGRVLHDHLSWYGCRRWTFHFCKRCCPAGSICPTSPIAMPFLNSNLSNCCTPQCSKVPLEMQPSVLELMPMRVRQKVPEKRRTYNAQYLGAYVTSARNTLLP